MVSSPLLGPASRGSFSRWTASCLRQSKHSQPANKTARVRTQPMTPKTRGVQTGSSAVLCITSWLWLACHWVVDRFTETVRAEHVLKIRVWYGKDGGSLIRSHVRSSPLFGLVRGPFSRWISSRMLLCRLSASVPKPYHCR